MEKFPDAVIILGHGSRVAQANEALGEVAALVAERLPGVAVSHGFLQLARPSLAEAVEKARAAGAGNLVVVPFFLYPGAHVAEDIPAEVEAQRAGHPDMTITISGHLGVHPLMAEIVARLATAAARGSSK